MGKVYFSSFNLIKNTKMFPKLQNQQTLVPQHLKPEVQSLVQLQVIMWSCFLLKLTSVAPTSSTHFLTLILDLYVSHLPMGPTCKEHLQRLNGQTLCGSQDLAAPGDRVGQRHPMHAFHQKTSIHGIHLVSIDEWWLVASQNGCRQRQACWDR